MKYLIEIDEKKFEISPGENLLKICRENNIDILGYCYNSSIENIGHCDLCWIYDYNLGKPVRACEITINQDGKYSTDIEKIKSEIQATLNYQLENHPAWCSICDKLGECSLQNAIVRFGDYLDVKQPVGEIKFSVEKLGDKLLYIEDLCVGCNKCISFLKKITNLDNLELLNGKMKIKRPLHSSYSNNLYDLCPVGAITPVEKKNSLFPFEYYFKKTTCIGCNTLCEVELDFHKKDHSICRTRPRQMGKNWLCDNGRSVFNYTTNKFRIFDVFQNINGVFNKSSTEEVFKKLKNKNIKVILSSNLLNHEYQNIFKLLSKKEIEVSVYSLPLIEKDFDGILQSGDKNSNLYGLKSALSDFPDLSFANDFEKVIENLTDNDVVLLIMPEVVYDKDHLFEMVGHLGRANTKIAFTCHNEWHLFKEFNYLLPVPSFLEKSGEITSAEDVNIKTSSITLNKFKFDVSYYLKILLNEL